MKLKKKINKIISILLIIITLIVAIPVTPISQWITDSILTPVQAVGVKTIDLTGISAGTDANHNHIYEGKYDTNYHWQQCWICGRRVNVTAHNMQRVGVDSCLAAAGTMKDYCASGCGYSVDLPKKQHTWPSTWNSKSAAHGLHYKYCLECGSWLETEGCINSSGQRLGCITHIAGYCVKCGLYYTGTEHGYMSYSGNNILCAICSQVFGTYNVQKQIVNESTTRVIYTYYLNNGVTISGIPNNIDNSLTVTSCSIGHNGTWDYQLESAYQSGNTVVLTGLYSSNNTATASHIEGDIRSGSWYYNGVLQNWFHGAGTTLSPDNYAPRKNSISATGMGTAGNFSTNAKITAVYTDGWLSENNIVSMRLVDKDKSTAITNWGTASRNGTTYTRVMDVVAEIREPANVYIQVRDAIGNTTVLENGALTVQYIDALPPRLTGGKTSSTNWTTSKEITYTTLDQGVGGVQIAFNQESEFQLANKNGDIYTRTYNFVGDVYGDIEAALYIKDALGNIRTERVKISNIDNTAPTITNITDTLAANRQSSVIGVVANDENAVLKAQGRTYNGSGIVGYALSTTNTVPTTFQSSSNFTVTQNGVYYLWAKDAVGNISQVKTKTITNIEYRAKYHLVKTDSITGERLNGATFGVYEWNGSAYARKGTLVDNGDGTYSTEILNSNLTNLGKFRIIEESAPTYYTNSGWTKDVTITEPGYHEYTYSLTNEPNKVKVQAIKVDSETKNRISGAIFTIYEWNKNKGAYEVYSRDETLDFQSDRSYLSEWLYSNRKNEGKFKIIETTAPFGYYGDFNTNGSKVEKDITITQSLDKQTIVIQNGGGLYNNTRVKGTINVNKIDIETNRYLAQGDATLDGAVYGLYADEDIYHMDTVKGKIYNKDQLVQSQTIANGRLVFENVEIGRYYIREITPPRGYVLSAEKYPINMNYEGETVSHLTRSTTVKEKVIKQAFGLQKSSINGSATESTPLQGAGFKIYLIKDLEGVKNGSIRPHSNGKYEGTDFIGYNFGAELTALDYSNNVNGDRIPELFTDELGKLTSPELAYGQYVVIESTVPEDMSVIKPFIVTIEEDSRTPQKQRYFIDKEFESLVKIIKKDALNRTNSIKQKCKIQNMEHN